MFMRILWLTALQTLVSFAALPQSLSSDVSPESCRVEYSNGNIFEIITKAQLEISMQVPVRGEKERFSVFVSLSNNRMSSVDVNPAVFRARLNDSNDTNDLELTDMDAVLSKEQRSAQKRQAMADAFGAVGASYSTKTATVHNSDGTNSTVNYHNPDADTSASNTSANQHARLTNYYQSASATLLRRNTVQPSSTIRGFIYFTAPKHTNKKISLQQIILKVGTDDYTFYWQDAEPKALCR